MPSHSMLKWEDTCIHQVNHVSNCYDELEWLGGSVKNPPANAGDMGSIPGLRSPGEENANPLQYSCLGNPMDAGAWQAIVHWVTKEPDTT